MKIRHEHETWINTLMSKIRIYSQLERLKQYGEGLNDSKSVEKHERYVEESTKTLADIENSLYLKLDEVGDRMVNHD
jgi:hypothetical protein|tara:strand:+ start:464 stop:694 length:231 start_codon:yes stop_codon:yes gene_type:complete